MKTSLNCLVLLFVFCFVPELLPAQVLWDSDHSYLDEGKEGVVRITLPGESREVLVPESALGRVRTPEEPLHFTASEDGNTLLFQTDTRREFHNTFASYYAYHLPTKTWHPIGSSFGRGQLLNGKISPDGQWVAFVYRSNIYVEELATKQTKALTQNGTDKLLNGWFDYVYSEELFLTDGLRWSSDSKKLVFWQMDLSKEGTFYMINNTDSIYPKLVPFAFSKPGQPIAEAKIGVIEVASGKTSFIPLEGDPQQFYIPQVEWTPTGNRLLLQQLNRRQNESKLLLCDLDKGSQQLIYTDRDEAWVDIKAFWMRRSNGFDWIEGGEAFIWASEKSGWRKLYRIGLDGKERLITGGDYDVISFNGVDEQKGLVYFMASPENASQSYLFQAKLDGSGTPKRLSPTGLEGTHQYTFAPGGKWAQHSFSSHRYLPTTEWLSMPDHRPLGQTEAIANNLRENPKAGAISFFQVTTEEGVKVDGWMMKPKDFDPNKKYPIVFNVYSEPAASTVRDAATLGGRGSFFDVDSGYILLSVEGRGTPVPKGRAWRKAIYRNLGWVNVIDQVGAAKKILEWPFVDKNRVAVYGSSGGGSTTLHLLFRYPEIYKVGLASAGVPSHFLYNSIYQERFLGLLPECQADYVKGSAITYAKNLQGHLLIMHGTGDHNVHYQGEELLLNELIKYNKQFKFMPYPNRTHGISEGEGTALHKQTMMADFLRQYCPPGGI